VNIRISTDLLTGLLFVSLGGFAIAYGWNYPLGTPARIGPGYYPMLVSSGLILIGIVLIGRSILMDSERLEPIAVRPMAFVLTGTLIFGSIVESSGFILASILLVVAARLADRDFRPLEVGILALVLVAFIAALFWLGLSLPLKPLPRW